METLKNAWICQVRGNDIIPVFGNLYIANGKITEIRSKDDHKNDHKNNNLPNTLDAGGRIVTPPLVNFHDHFYSRLAKGLAPSGPMDSFRHILRNFWWKMDITLDLDMIEACARLAAFESIRCGVTYIFDHHSSPVNIEGSLCTIANVLRKNSLRGVLCFETSDRNGSETAIRSLEENRAFVTYALDSEIRGMMGLHAPFTLSDSSLKKAADLCSDTGIGIHIHLSESADDLEYSIRQYGKSPAARLKGFNLLSNNSILAHGVHLTAEEYSIIEESESAVVYSPDSNMNNSVGLPDYTQTPDKIPILAGTDGMHSNIARSLKQLFLLYRHQGASVEESFKWLQKIYFDQLCFVRRFFPDYPSLLSGDRADFIVWDYIPPTPITADNFWGHYIFGILESPVCHVIQGGQLLKGASPVSKQGERLFNMIKKNS